MQDSAIDVLHSQQNKAAGGWMDTILNLIPGRKQQSSNEPSEEAIKRTHDFLRYFFRFTSSLSTNTSTNVSAVPSTLAYYSCTLD